MAESNGAFVWYELMTTDQTAAQRFYGDVVGWTAKDAGMPGMHYTLLETAGTQIAGIMDLMPGMIEAGMRPSWVGYVSVPDVDQAADRLTRLGGRVYRQPTDIPGVGRFAVVADPQGAVFHLFKSSGGTAPTFSMHAGHVGWHELHTSDYVKGLEFYSEMFGWDKGGSHEMGPMGTYQMFDLDGIAIGGMFNSPAAAHAKFWLFYFAVEDITATGARITQGGGTIMMGPQEIPGGGFIIQAKDPQGAMFAVVAPPPK